MKIGKITLASAVFILALFATQANATILSETWYLTISNDAALPSGVNYGTITVEVDDILHTAEFTVDVNQLAFTPAGNFGIDDFWFNTTLSTIELTDFSTAAGWQAAINPNGSVGEFGKFELQYNGNGGVRTDPLIFTITDSGITSPFNFFEPNVKGNHFAAHIAGYTNTDAGSAKFTDGTPVPEPGTLILLGGGLVGLAAYRMRRKE